VLEDNIASRLMLSPMDRPRGAHRGTLQVGPTRSTACLPGAPLFVSLGASPSSSRPNRGIGRVVPGGRDPPSQGPVPAAPSLRGLGLIRRRCGVSWVLELGCSGWVSEAHRATFPSAPQAVGTWVVLEDVCPVGEAQGLLLLDLTHFPGNPEDCRGSIDSLALRCHCCYLPFVQNRGLPPDAQAPLRTRLTPSQTSCRVRGARPGRACPGCGRCAGGSRGSSCGSSIRTGAVMAAVLGWVRRPAFLLGHGL
jgi:hypothetical protein